jgi:hypothetical protein
VGGPNVVGGAVEARGGIGVLERSGALGADVQDGGLYVDIGFSETGWKGVAPVGKFADVGLEVVGGRQKAGSSRKRFMNG